MLIYLEYDQAALGRVPGVLFIEVAASEVFREVMAVFYCEEMKGVTADGDFVKVC